MYLANNFIYSNGPTYSDQVRNCVAHDGRKAPIQLVDQKGCVVRPKIMSPFKKLKNFDATANVLAYAYFQVSASARSYKYSFQLKVALR